jgi:hypothetical protein
MTICDFRVQSHLENIRTIGTLQLGLNMSLVVKLEDQQGERGEWAMLHGVIPSHDESTFPVLRGVDPYGTTVFNHLQMDAFIEEWQRVRDRATDENQKEAWAKVNEMAAACQSDRDLSLKFVGN